MEQGAADLGHELRQLYRAAGSPAVDKLVELSQGRLPVSHWPTPSSVRGWFHEGAAPVSCAVLLVFVELLDGFARQASDGAHLPRSAQWWELLWYRTTRPQPLAPDGPDGPHRPPRAAATSSRATPGSSAPPCRPAPSTAGARPPTGRTRRRTARAGPLGTTAARPTGGHPGPTGHGDHRVLR
ncbi:hypothetical protein O1L55_14390 [Streptomyces albulus]|nr:hypothetical protein [Streptomyces noursei]